MLTSIKEKIKLFLWGMGLHKACPYCECKIREGKYPDLWDYYPICENPSCKFNNKRGKGENLALLIPNTINNLLIIFMLFLMFLLCVFLYVVTFPAKIFKWVSKPFKNKRT